MAEQLERELRALAPALAFPPEPELAARVAAHLRDERPPRRSRRPLALALAVLVVALAVPPVRGAILDLLGIDGVTIVRVDELPPVTPDKPLALGRPTDLAAARAAVDFPVLVPGGLGPPDAVYASSTFPGGSVSLLYGTERRVRLLVTELRGSPDLPLVQKFVRPETRIEPVTVRGRDGFFIDGAPHAVVFRDASGEIREDEYRLARNVLLWEEDGVTYRLEADVDRERAIALAESLR